MRPEPRRSPPPAAPSVLAFAFGVVAPSAEANCPQRVRVRRAACASDGACTGGGGWAWLVCLQQAILDASAALQCLQQLSNATFSNNQPGSNGNSLTDALYWIGTRPV